MAVAFDAASQAHTTGGTGAASVATFSWTHTPSGTPKGVCVFTFVMNGSGDLASGVTYNGISMSAVTGGRAADTAGEIGDSKAWFLGSGLPTGAQLIEVTRTNNAIPMTAHAVTVTAAADTEIKGTPVLLQEDGTLAEQNVDAGAGVDALRLCGLYSGLNTAAAPSVGANSTAAATFEISGGARRALTARETTTGTGSRPVGYSSGSSEDRAAVHLAIGEVAGGGGGGKPWLYYARQRAA